MEDDPIVLENYYELINESFDSIKVDKFLDYQTASDAIQRESYDLAILDIFLGCASSGIDLAREIKQKSDSKVVFLTAYDDQQTFDSALKTGPDFYLTKPVQDNQFVSTLKYFLKSKSMYEEFKKTNLTDQTIQYNFIPAVDFYRSAIDLTCLVSVTDEKGLILSANSKFCNVSQYTEAELLGKDHRIVNSGEHDQEFFKNMWKTLKNKNIWAGEIKNKKKDGSFYWVFSTIIPILGNNGEIIKYFSIRQDVTENKWIEDSYKNLYALKVEELAKTQEKTIHMSKMLALNSLSSALAHDVKGPLASLVLFMDAFKNVGSMNQDKFDVICKKTKTRLRDVLKILDSVYSTMKSGTEGDCTEFDICITVNDIIEIIKKNLSYRNINIFLNESLRGKYVKEFAISKENLEYIILNLVKNSVDAVEKLQPEQGTIEIHLCDNEWGKFNIVVSDNGCGIKDEDIEKIFDIMYSQSEGTGFGLAMVEQIVKKSGGKIEVSSEVNKGSEINISLPYNKGEVENEPE